MQRASAHHRPIHFPHPPPLLIITTPLTTPIYSGRPVHVLFWIQPLMLDVKAYNSSTFFQEGLGHGQALGCGLIHRILFTWGYHKPACNPVVTSHMI